MAKNRTAFPEAQHRMGTSAVLTDLDEGGERIFELLKSRVDVEQLYEMRTGC